MEDQTSFGPESSNNRDCDSVVNLIGNRFQFRGFRRRCVAASAHVLVAALCLIAVGIGVARAQVVTEFTIPTPSAGLAGITAGPDGNLWFTESADGIGKIGRITPAGIVTEFSLTSTISEPGQITAGPDGNIWFIELSYNEDFPTVGRITPTGTLTEFATGLSLDGGIAVGPDGNLWVTYFDGILRFTPAGVESFVVMPESFMGPHCIAAGADGNLWFTNAGNGYANAIGRTTPSGVSTFAAFIPSGASASCITAGPDGNLWFTETSDDQIGRITLSDSITEFGAGITPNAGPTSITAGPDGNLWFTEPTANQIARITPAGVVTEFSDGITPNANISSITAGPDGNIWFTEYGANKIGQITTASATPPPTSVSVLSPSSGPAGMRVVVLGASFGASQGASSFSICGTTPAITFWSDNAIGFVVPALQLGRVCTVTVATALGSGTSPPFDVTGKSSISGSVLTSADAPLAKATLTMIGPSLRTVVSNDKGSFTSSGLPQGSYTITPHLAGYEFSPLSDTVSLTATAAIGVNFIGSAINPHLIKINPAVGPSATAVTLTGSGFGSSMPSGASVMFGTSAATVQSWTDSQIIALAPTQTRGTSVPVTVNVPGIACNSKPFTYSTAKLHLVPSGDFDVLVFGDMTPISDTSDSVTVALEIVNITQTWYYVTVMPTSNVTGLSATQPFVIGPGQTKSLGTVTFGSLGQLIVLAENSIDLSTCPPCNPQTQSVLTVVGVDMLFRAVFNQPLPLTLSGWVETGASEVNGPIFALGSDVANALRGNDSVLLAVPNDIYKALNDPIVETAIQQAGLTEPLTQIPYLTLFARLVVELDFVINTSFIYPHVGTLKFNAK